MRLINVHNYQLEYFDDANAPPYAILSHTWDKNEASHRQLQKAARHSKSGKRFGEGSEDAYRKIIYTCKQAARDGLDYVWIDTCCIDKSSSEELSEAINSMFQWYHQARVCYAYLSDVTDIKNAVVRESEFRASRWFTRGWTLQELLAPRDLRFYSHDWKLIGPITSLYDTIKDITGIETSYLEKNPYSPFTFRHANVATRMSWAAKRQTTRIEDLAYCLFGIFDVNMPVLYGEGKNAFIRLQEEIIKRSDDVTILAWGWGEGEHYSTPYDHGYLAASPANFINCRDLVPWSGAGQATTLAITNRGLQITVPIQQVEGNKYNAILRCKRRAADNEVVALPLLKLETSGGIWDDGISYSRTDRVPHTISADGLPEQLTTIRISHRPWWSGIILNSPGRKTVYFRKVPAACSIVSVSHTGELLPHSNVLSIGGTNISQPRFVYIQSSSCGGIVARLQWKGDMLGWDCGMAAMQLAKNANIAEPRAFIPLVRMQFHSVIMIGNSLFNIHLQAEKVFGETLAIVDLIESQPQALAWANAFASQKFLTEERVDQILFLAGALSEILKTEPDGTIMIGLAGILGVLSIGGYGRMGPVVAS